MLGAGLRLVRRIGLWRMARVGWRGALKAPTILLRRDFPSILSVLYDIEYAAFRAFQPKILLLHPQIADLALALGQRRVFAGFAAAARRRWGAAPGVCTHNFGWMAQRLSEWGVDIRIAMTPVNREGWRMKPDRQTCERYLRDERFCVIADLPGVGSRVSEEEIAAARAFAAVKSVAIDPFMENANR